MALGATPQQEQFITTYQPYAVDAGKRLGVDPNIILGQWGHETGWGSSVGTQHNNLGGITAPSGQYYSYADPQQFTDHYTQLLQSKYPQVLGTGSNADKFVAGLYQGHYFTGPFGDYVADVNNGASLVQQALARRPQQPPQQPPAPQAQAEPPSKFDQLLQQKQQEQQAPQAPPAAAPAAPPQGPQDAPQGPSKFDQLLQQKQAEQTPPPAESTAPPLPNVSEFGDVGPDAWFNKPGGQPPPADNAITRIGSAAAGAYEATPPILTPAAKEAVSNWTPGGLQLGRYIVNPLLDIGGAAIGGAAALGAGGQQAAIEASKAVTGDEAAGRAANLLMQSVPAGQWEGAMNPLRYPGAPPLTKTPPLVGEGPLIPPGGSLERITSAIKSADSGIPTPPTYAETRLPPELEPGAPASVGAMGTPYSQSLFTPAEERMYRGSAEGQKLLEPQVKGEPDTKVYVPGSNPNLAEQEQTVAMARELKGLGISSPEASQEVKLAQQEQNTARRAYWEQTRGSDADKFHEQQARQDDIEAAKPQVFAPTNVKGPVSMAPVIQKIDGMLNDPVNVENTPMQKVLGDLRQRLTAADGTPRTMPPEQAWGLRQDIDRMMNDTQGTDPEARNLRRVTSQLGQVADTIDTGIEAQAPGYSDMLQTYKQHSARINEMDVLQKAEPGLFQGTDQNMTFGNFQRFMKNVVRARMTGTNDLNPYKSISDDTMAKLWNLRDDLRRSASAMELARAAGSDTMPNVIDQMLQYGKLGGSVAIDAVANHLFPVGGPIVVHGAKALLRPIRQAGAAQKTMARTREILGTNPLVQKPWGQGGPTPPPYNPLTPPP